MRRRNLTPFEGARRIRSSGLAKPGASLDGLSPVETDDCFLIAEPIGYQATGLAETGKGCRIMRRTHKVGKLSVNQSILRPTTFRFWRA